VLLSIAAVMLLTAEVAIASSYSRAKQIVYSIFPKETAAAAMRVVACETGNTFSPWAYNSSGASGYFQILTGNHGRVFNYAGQYFRLVVWNQGKNQLFNPWYNTKAAFYMSRGGYDWHEWSCQP
jgi:hypothetical protein